MDFQQILKHAKRGVHQTPALPGRRSPKGMAGWRERATTSIEKLRALYEQYPNHNWCSVARKGLVAAQRGTWLRFLQGCVKPIWSQLGDGCHPDRETWLTLEAAGFAKLTYQRVEAPSLIVSPQIVGVAVKAT
jgi:hypothetical protein